MTDYTSPLRSAADLEDRVRQIGFLPYFRNRIPGLSVEEMTPSNILWDENGPWEWKGDIARGMTSAYGKFFHGKAGYVSREWLADFTNYRRWCAPLENAIPDSLGNNVDAIILDILSLTGRCARPTSATPQDSNASHANNILRCRKQPKRQPIMRTPENAEKQPLQGRMSDLTLE